MLVLRAGGASSADIESTCIPCSGQLPRRQRPLRSQSRCATRKKLTELPPSLLNGVSFAVGSKRLELERTGIPFGNEALCESIELDVLKDTLHVHFDLRRDNAGAGDVVTIL